MDTEHSLRARIQELEDAIKKHRAAVGHDLCWENDDELHSVLKDGVVVNHTRPTKSEFMTRCEQYCDSRKAPSGDK